MGQVEELFALFVKELEKLNLTVNAGKIMDASFVEVPRQRNKKEENGQIGAGEGSSLWKDKPFKKINPLKSGKKIPTPGGRRKTDKIFSDTKTV